MALPVNGSKHLIPALLLIYRPRKDERLSWPGWPGWLTCSGWFTHISGHPSAAGQAQDRESSPVRDRRSTTVPRHQPSGKPVQQRNSVFLLLFCHWCIAYHHVITKVRQLSWACLFWQPITVLFLTLFFMLLCFKLFCVTLLHGI